MKHDQHQSASFRHLSPNLGFPHNLLPRAMSALALVGTVLSGCTSLPSNGPTSHDIVKASRGPKNTLNYRIVEFDAKTAAVPPVPSDFGLRKLAMFAEAPLPARSDMILPGDNLIVSVYEVGVSLFAGPTSNINTTNTIPGIGPGAAAHNIPVTVRDDGSITLPYVGTMKVAGEYPEDLAARVRSRLAPNSQNPQVEVSISESVNNVAYVLGAVVRSGRYRLTEAHEHLLDMVALAGGTPLDVNDAEVHFTRQGQSATVRLADLRAEDKSNVEILPGDHIEIRKQRKTITVFGATDRVSEIPFESARLSLAEAIARSSGPADSRANARGVYVFRLERDRDDNVVRPTIYHVNMMDPQTYFIAQTFQMRDKDTILYANSPSDLVQKFAGMLNLLFSPALGIRYAAQ